VNTKSGELIITTKPQIYAIGIIARPLSSVVRPLSSALCFLSSAERSEVPARRETIFIQNKPNFRNAQINVSAVTIANYEEYRPCSPRKNKPKQTQYKPKQSQLQKGTK
jgi:hypothetical protein